jgi:FeS assembly SUF system protein
MAEAKAKVTETQVVDALREVYDPEIPINIYDLGLIYDIQVDDKNKVYVQMTLTAPGCGMGPYIAQQAQWRIAEVEGVEDVQVELVWDPPWTPDMLRPEGKKLLGLE